MTAKARVMALLISEIERAFCERCLADALDVSAGIARWATLTLGSGFERCYDECSRCGESRLVVAYRRRVATTTSGRRVMA